MRVVVVAADIPESGNPLPHWYSFCWAYYAALKRIPDIDVIWADSILKFQQVYKTLSYDLVFMVDFCHLLGLRQLNEHIIEHITNVGAQLVFLAYESTLYPELTPPTTIEELNQNCYMHRMICEHASLIAFMDSADAYAYKLAGYPAMHLPHSVDITIFKHEPAIPYTNSLGFIGSIHVGARKNIAAAIGHIVPLSISSLPPPGNNYAEKLANIANYARTLQTYMATLNLRTNFNGKTLRVVESMACGVPVITCGIKSVPGRTENYEGMPGVYVYDEIYGDDRISDQIGLEQIKEYVEQIKILDRADLAHRQYAWIEQQASIDLAIQRIMLNL